MPLVYHALTEPQRDQVQRFLDAQVLNPVIEKEFKELDHKSIIAESNGYTNRNPAIVAQRDKKSEEYIRLGDSDKRIRILDFSKLLARDAFQMETDNPDEASYHMRVRNTLAAHGVWLRLDRRNPNAVGNPGSLPENDPKRYSFALSVGGENDSSLIPTMNGVISRDTLVKTSLFADNYFEHVVRGPTRRLLEKTIIELDTQAEHGWRDHSEYEKVDLARVARGITEQYTLIRLPDIRIWGQARAKLQLATQQLQKGQLALADLHILEAADLIASVAVALDHYQNAANIFSSRVVSAMEVAIKIVAIVEALNIAHSIGKRLIRALAAKGAPVVAESAAGVTSGAAATQAAKRGSTTVLTGGSGAPGAANRGSTTVMTGGSARPGAAANGNATVLTTGAGSSKPGAVAQRTLPPDPPPLIYGDKAYIETKQMSQSYERAIQRGERYVGKDTGSSRVSGAWEMTSEELAADKRLESFLKEFFQELKAYKKQHPRLPDYTPQTELIHRRLAAKWHIRNPE
jgi:hypothetical protein